MTVSNFKDFKHTENRTAFNGKIPFNAKITRTKIPLLFLGWTISLSRSKRARASLNLF